MTYQARPEIEARAPEHRPSWLWLAQAALAFILFCLLTGLWAYLWLSSAL